MSDADEQQTARYAGFWAKLDCGACGAEIEVEGDVTNGEKLTCPDCGVTVEVYGR